MQILADAGLQAAVLRVAPDKREAWVAKQVENSVDVIITHPKKVETGMDLLQFPTIIWMGIEYSVYTVMQASRRSWRIGQEEDVQVYFFNYDDTLQHDAMYLIAAKIAASVRVNGDLIQDDSLAELDDLSNSDMITALANIVTKGNSATQSLSDAFATANQEFGMAERLIGEYQVIDQLPVTKEKEEEPKTKEPTNQEKNEPTKEAHTLMHHADGTRANSLHQLSLLTDMEPVANVSAKNGRANGHTQNGHTQNGHAQNGLPAPPQLLNLAFNQKGNESKSTKRRRKYRRGRSLFDTLRT